MFLSMFKIFSLILFFISMSASQVKTNSLESLSWIVDNWINEDSSGVTRERWTKIDENKFEGESYTIQNGDTVFSEKLLIEKKGDEIYYTAIVKHNPGSVSFKMTELSAGYAVFENPEHDFPQKSAINFRMTAAFLHG